MPKLNWIQINSHPAKLDCLNFIQPQRFIIDKSNEERILDEAKNIIRGKMVLFSFHSKNVGFPPNWHKNQMTGEITLKNLHWSKIGDFGSGDIKCTWELNRFPWVYPLIRAYNLTQDDKYADAFWKLFEDWLSYNQPNCGVNWKCGQEATFRLIATCFAIKTFSNSIATNLDRLVKWRKFLVFTGQRIKSNINYALSQNNNHGISECVGYLTIAKLLNINDDFCKKIKIKLIEQLSNLIYEDGAFAQHSTIYHRLVMDDLSWLIALCKYNNDDYWLRLIPYSKKLLNFMIYITDLDSGVAPIHGANDGSRIFPLTNNDYLDMRPSIDLLSTIIYNQTPISDKSSHEILHWFGLQTNYIPHNKRLVLNQSGWYMVKNNNFKAFMYSPNSFVHRPSQGNILHTDIWFKGIPITRDTGSYSYNSKDLICSILNSTYAHNTIIIDNQEQMKKISRFLCVPWPKSSIYLRNFAISSTTNLYKKNGVIVTRNLDYSESKIKIIDEINALDSHKHVCKIHWLLADYEYELYDQDEFSIIKLFTPKGCIYIKINVSSNEILLEKCNQINGMGWYSPYYYCYKPALSVSISKEFKEATVITIDFYM